MSRNEATQVRFPQSLREPIPAIEWARRLAADVEAVRKAHPEAEPENVRRALISLQSLPPERLSRSLRRGRGFAAFRK
ncbi:MAG TPA: hypothetical protein DCE44_15645 [Verrucomicrobiales bacterium]|nr:hypothetical protein [Verrucomicrobiales bacterium]